MQLHFVVPAQTAAVQDSISQTTATLILILHAIQTKESAQNLQQVLNTSGMQGKQAGNALGQQCLQRNNTRVQGG
jgi:hypothetical protein